MTTPTIGELERRIADLEARAEEWDEAIGMVDGESEAYEDPEPSFVDRSERAEKDIRKEIEQLLSRRALITPTKRSDGWIATVKRDGSEFGGHELREIQSAGWYVSGVWIDATSENLNIQLREQEGKQ